MSSNVYLKDGEVFIEGRSQEKALELLGNAGNAGVDHRLVKTTTFGYVVPDYVRDGTQPPEPEPEPDPEPEPEPEPEDPGDDEEGEGINMMSTNEFDPSDHGIGEVKAYLADADEEERQRVLDAERSGKARKSLLPDDEREED